MLRSLDVLVVDCQASGASPTHGDLLELGWAVTGSGAMAVPTRAHWIVPATDRPVSRPVRQLTGWTDACLAEAIVATDAWSRLEEDAKRATASDGSLVPTVIHFARFELAFLRDLHAKVAGAGGSPAFPFDTICLHAIAQRLFPDLPRKNLRAIAGHLGHSPELVRRSTGHVEASAFIWRAVVPLLEEAGVHTWEELKAWLEAPPPTSARTRTGRKKVGYPMPSEVRRALPDAPGVYRFLRPNGDVLYVGKAASLKKRVASHFSAGTRATERALEMLSQAHDIRITQTESILEAALLETDEIKRIDPPYNVQLRVGDRHAWFASTDWRTSAPVPDDVHRVGPLPSRRSLSPLGAVRALLERDGYEDDASLRAAALGVPTRFGPDATTFREAWSAFVDEHVRGAGSIASQLLRASLRIVPVDGPDDEDEVEPPGGWDVARVRRHLDRSVHGGGLLVRRARALALLSESVVVFREPRAEVARFLVVSGCEITARGAFEGVALEAIGGAMRRPRRARQEAFDAPRYDRLRVLATELRRVADQGGEVRIRVGRHVAQLQPASVPLVDAVET
ncbi:MAG: GIY-YIG nuclease family protein [Deltaproteobacteria bacterium]|nr:GIY-YIG nuclease family protein [Deltaproteobacteria bacterium]